MSDNPWEMLYQAFMAMEGPVAFAYRDYPLPGVTDAMLDAGMGALDQSLWGEQLFHAIYLAMHLYRPLSEGPEP